MLHPTPVVLPSLPSASRSASSCTVQPAQICCSPSTWQWETQSTARGGPSDKTEPTWTEDSKDQLSTSFNILFCSQACKVQQSKALKHTKTQPWQPWQPRDMCATMGSTRTLEKNSSNMSSVKLARARNGRILCLRQQHLRDTSKCSTFSPIGSQQHLAAHAASWHAHSTQTRQTRCVSGKLSVLFVLSRCLVLCLDLRHVFRGPQLLLHWKAAAHLCAIHSLEAGPEPLARMATTFWSA